MNDDYMHIDTSVIYVTESIPGPKEHGASYEDLLNLFNSQLDHCTCTYECLEASCKCINQSAGNNYEIFIEDGLLKQQRLNVNKDHDKYPIKECNDNCSCLEHCSNRLVQRGPLEGLTVQYCEAACKGQGLFTTNLIKKGSFICEYAGELITKSQAVFRNELNKSKLKMNYIFCLNEYSSSKHLQTFVDPSDIGNIGRYINHSCEPNSKILPVRVNSAVPKLAIFAVCDIHPNTEITYNYGENSNNYTIGILRKACLCNTTKCNGYLPFENY